MQSSMIAAASCTHLLFKVFKLMRAPLPYSPRRLPVNLLPPALAIFLCHRRLAFESTLSLLKLLLVRLWCCNQGQQLTTSYTLDTLAMLACAE